MHSSSRLLLESEAHSMLDELTNILKFFVKGRRSLALKAKDNDEEIMKRILRAPKWKHDDCSVMVNRFISCIKKPTLERSICKSKAAILIPLSPLQIYNIRIHPTAFAFGMVGTAENINVWNLYFL